MKKTLQCLKPFAPMIILGIILTFTQSMLSLYLFKSFVKANNTKNF